MAKNMFYITETNTYIFILFKNFKRKRVINMKNVTYDYFINLLNEVVDKPIDDNGFWDLKDIINRNTNYNASFLFDNQFTLFVECRNLELVEELIVFLITKKLSVYKVDETPEFLSLKDLLGEKVNKSENILAYEDGVFYFSFSPTNNEIPTFYAFINSYGRKIIEICNKYNGSIDMSFSQIDDAIDGKLIFNQDCYYLDCWIQTNLDLRCLYIAACMLNQLSGNKNEFEELKVDLLIDCNESIDDNVDIDSIININNNNFN